MIDIFLMKDLRALMQHKNIVFMGDSNIRALYKDFLCLLFNQIIIPDDKLRAKLAPSAFNDKLTFHSQLNNARSFREERQLNAEKFKASFYFITRVYDDYVKSVLERIKKDGDPDVLVINSCLWDLTRWGPKGVKNYKEDLPLLMTHLKSLFPDCLVIWMTAPPLSQEIRGGFLLADLQFLKYCLRFHVVEANHYARQVVVEHGFDVLDSHYHLKNQIHRRTGDGIHWTPEAVRYVLNLLLTHISLAWNVPLPRRYNSSFMEEALEKLEDELSKPDKPLKVKKQAAQSTQKTIKKEKKNFATTKMIKTEQENLDTPKIGKRKKRWSPQKKAIRAQSYHTYANKKRQQERRLRIRKWQSQVPHTSHSQYSSPANSQHDSGYFPSPSEAYLPNITITSPQYSQGSSGYGDTPIWQGKMYSDNYSSAQSLANPYSSAGYRYGKGRTLIQVPYAFNHGQQPRMDFTSDDFAAF